MPATPFTGPDLVAGPLYVTAARLAQRTGALHVAKISDDNATTTIVELAAQFAPETAVVCDIGCGRGTTTVQLARRLAPAQLIAVDQSPALLATVADRMADAGHAVEILHEEGAVDGRSRRRAAQRPSTARIIVSREDGMSGLVHWPSWRLGQYVSGPPWIAVAENIAFLVRDHSRSGASGGGGGVAALSLHLAGVGTRTPGGVGGLDVEIASDVRKPRSARGGATSVVTDDDCVCGFRHY